MQIETEIKDDIDKIMFGDLPMNKKRIEIRKLTKKGLNQRFVKVFINLLEYIDVV